MGKMADRLAIKQEKKNSANGQSVTQRTIFRPGLNETIRSVASAQSSSFRANEPEVIKEATIDNYQQFDWPREEVKGPLESYEIWGAFRKHKYILFLHPQLGPVAVTFPAWIVHADMYRAYRRFPLMAAGFYDLLVRNDEVKITAGGRSESLSCDSRGILDIEYIAKALGLEEQWGMNMLNGFRRGEAIVLSAKHLDDPVQEKEAFESDSKRRPGFPTHPRKDKSPGRFLARAKRK